MSSTVTRSALVLNSRDRLPRVVPFWTDQRRAARRCESRSVVGQGCAECRLATVVIDLHLMGRIPADKLRGGERSALADGNTMSKYLTNEIITGCSRTQEGTSEFGNFRTEALAAFLTLAHLSNNEPWHTLDISCGYGSRANLTFREEPPVESSQRTPDGALATVVSHITCF
jgi:hypothetical protein